MKKPFFTILAVLTSASALWADPIDLAEARKIAAAYMSEGTAPEPIVSCVTTRNTTNSNAPLYVFNRGNDRGFVIISGDDCMPKVLGYTEKGDFNLQALPPALLDWLEGYSTMIEKAQEANAPARIVTRATTDKQDVAPLVTAHWNQGAPYNNLCPYLVQNGSGRALTGCVATAAAQVIYYWRKENPKTTLYDTPTYGYGDAPVTTSIPGGTPLKYELMQDSYSGTTPEDMNTAVATLMSVVGTSTWLTYGSSTSGQISNLVNTFWGQFHLNSVCTYKSGYSQTAWENMIYKDLEKGWPIVYSGVSPTAGGHAVIVDGYRASDNLFHFNFGWGGQGDGYFTVNDTNGMNGFNGQQGMTHGIHPSTYLLTGKLNTPSLYTRMSNTIEAEITNNGTVAYSGLYLVVSKNATVPTDISSSNAKNLTTVIPQGETGLVTLNYRPVVAGTYYLFLLDGNAQLLDQTSVETKEQSPMLTLESLKLRNGIAGQESISIDGQPATIIYNNVYSDLAEVVATISNAEEATNTTPLITGTLYAYDESQEAFVSQKKLSSSTLIYPSGDITNLIFSLSDLDKNRLYGVEIAETYKISSTEYHLNLNTESRIAYFKLQESDFAMTLTEDNGAVVTGHWDADKFKELAQSTDITYYDLTAVEGIDVQPEAGNPNALFYVNDHVTLSGYNMIRNNICERLQLTYGYDFKARENFTAQQVVFDPQTTPLQWSYIVLPFDCNVPTGSMARKINKLTNSLISDADAVNTKMERCIPYLYKSTHTGDRLTAENVEVCAVPTNSSDTLKTTFTSFFGTEDTKKLNKETIQKFTTAKNFTVPAFSGYLNYSKEVEADVPLYYTQDEAAKKLAVTLNEAFDMQETYQGKVPDDTWKRFIDLIHDAGACYTQQSSIDGITDMTTLLAESMNNVALQEIYLGEPIELTEYYLENPSFEKGRTTGWTITRTTGQLSKIVNVSTLAEYMVDADGTYVFYSYSTSGKGSVTLSQTVTDIPDGIYRLSAKLATDERQSVTLYANDRTATMTDNGFGIRYLKETVIDSIKVENGTLEVGVNGTEYSYKADDFRLYYIGALENAITDTRTATETLKVWGGEGSIHIFTGTETPVKVCIYGTNGKLYRQLTVEGTGKVGNLQKGIYIVNKQKVMVR